MKIPRTHGFTLIELVTVIAVMSILLSIALPAFREMVASQKVKSTASTLQTSLLLTRSEALKRNTNVTLAPTTTGNPWNGGWSVQLTDGTVLSTYSPVTAVNITGGPTSVVFQNTGRVVSGIGAIFKVSSTDTTAIRCVMLSLTGMPAVTTSGC
ncbi:MAG: GspH/FimT family pseudopilin [Formivibrio sp.]|nr:GspH/FimT family pseudopilin [Formivibrio sp.]